MSIRRVLAALAASVLVHASGAAQQPSPPKAASAPASTLPGGASEIQETHGDWRVRCQHSRDLTCVVGQQQADKDTRQLVLGIELTSVSVDKAQGTIVLPFGLDVTRPVTLQIDDAAGRSVPFRTCVPVGCLVPVTFEGPALANLRKGAVLTVRANAPDGVQETGFRISLTGIGSALDRARTLAQ